MACFFNHPIRIVCPNVVTQCSNDIINPVILNDYAFFNNTGATEIAPDTTIPVTLVINRGSNITQSITTTGAISLQPGVYEVTYSVTGTIPAGGTIETELELNGVTISGSTLTVSQTAGETISMSQTLIINVPAISTLQLINAGAEETTFSYVGVTLNRL
ncbi:MAG: hypothetical protein IJ817_00250 [Clostridia bacterium]|nr:hypothetical protein [Clostridia bacterium]